MDQNDKQKKELIRQLKKANAFWSYKSSAIKDVPDDVLVELVMLHLDLDDINILFEIFPYKFVKEAWIKNVVIQGEMYYVLNKFFAWYYFKMKKPGAYVRSMATREHNKKIDSVMKGLAPQTSELFDAAPRKQLSTMQPIVFRNNLRIADVRTIGALKMEVMLRRAKYRDYYDLYSILKSGVDINELIPLALEHSGHKLKQKNLLAMITNGEFFSKDSQFEALSPIYNVTSTDIQEFIKAKLQNATSYKA